MEKKTRVLSVSCQKGGVGKTLTSLNLSYALSKLGYKVLLCDMDPQASASLLCNVDITDNDMLSMSTVFEYYMNCLIEREVPQAEEFKKCIIKPFYTLPVRKNKGYFSEEIPFGFDLIPANIELANYDIELNQFQLNGKLIGGYIMQRIVKIFKEKFDYDFIILDVLPGLNMIAYNALAAATDGNILTINMDKSAITGGENLLSCITKIQQLLWYDLEYKDDVEITKNGEERIVEVIDWEKTKVKKNPIKHTGIIGVLKNEYKPKRKITKILDDNLYNYFGPAHIFETTIPTKASCDTAHEKGRLYAEYDSAVGAIFENLAKEVVDECNKRDLETEPVFIRKFGKEYIESQNK